LDSYSTSNSNLPNNLVWTIAIDGSGNKWIGTESGSLAKFDGTLWMIYNYGGSINSINSIAIDRNGNKWIGTWGVGLAKFDNTLWTVFNVSDSGLPNNYIQSIAIDSSGNEWIGNYNNGIVKFDGVNGQRMTQPMPVYFVTLFCQYT